MRKILILAAAVVCLSAQSCKKDSSTQTNNPGTGVTKLLKKITKTEAGVSKVSNLTYDAQKRLVSIISADNSEVTLLTYDAAGNLTKIDETEEQFHNIYTYSYANNIPVSATLKSWEKHTGAADELIEDDKLTYTVANGQVTNIRLTMQDGSFGDFKLTYTGENLTKVESVGNDLYKANFTWGTKRSPYPQATKYVLDQAGFSLILFAKNEMKVSSFDFPGTVIDKTITAMYTYDADGYPLTSVQDGLQMAFEYQ